MSGAAILRAVRGGIARRRLQTGVVALVVLISTASTVVALALVVNSEAPFDHAFAAQHGADIVATLASERGGSEPRADGASLRSDGRRRPLRRGDGDGKERRDELRAADPRRPRHSRWASRRPRDPGWTLGDTAWPGRARHRRQRPRILRRLHDDRGCRHAPAEADRRRPRELDHRLRLGVGRPRRDSASPGRGRNKRHPDALPVRRRQDRRAAPRRRGQAHGGSAERCARRNDVVLHRQGRGGRQHRPVRPVLARLRDPRDCDVGADRRECRQRRGRLWVPADRDPEEHRLHADAGRRGICGPGCAPGPRRLPRRSRGRQPARNSAPSAERQRLRRRSARRPDLGRRRGTRRNPRSGRRRRAPARPASRAGSAAFKRSRSDGPLRRAAATPHTGCSAGCPCRVP